MREHLLSGRLAPSAACGTDRLRSLSIGCSAACGNNRFRRPAIRILPSAGARAGLIGSAAPPFGCEKLDLKSASRFIIKLSCKKEKNDAVQQSWKQ